MRSISFANPYLLLLAIPLLAAVIVPIAIAIRKDNRSRSVVVSFVLHLLIVCLVVLSVAGTVSTTVMTETNVYVLADVSGSATRNLDTVDAYIRALEPTLPRKSKIGVIAFGKDQKLISEMGGEFVTVKESGVDDGATDIAGALLYAAGLFDANVIKRVVLITDGKETAHANSAPVIAAVDHLYANNIYVDAVYLDNNLSTDDTEVQIGGADFTDHTYVGHTNTLSVEVRSSFETQAVLTLYRNSEKCASKAVKLTKGFNYVGFALDTGVAGVFDYEVKLSAEGDTSELNNTYSFTQRVAQDVKVLLITSDQQDVTAAERLYAGQATIDSYVNESRVPFSLEEICAYDEIILSNVDVRALENYTAFIDSLDKAVSLFGKSLVTLGDTRIQNKTDEVLKRLEAMLPLKYGNTDGDPKLYGIVIDTSRSMQNAAHLIMAKQAAEQLLRLLNDNDYVTVVSFSGDVRIVTQPIQATNRDAIIKEINAIEATQGTFIGRGLDVAFDMMKDLPYDDKQVMLISDGMTYTAEPENVVDVATEMYENGIVVSTINTATKEGVSTLEQVAQAGHGSYFWVEEKTVTDLILNEVANELTDTVIEEPSPVTVVRKNDAVTEGFTSLPAVNGYIYAKAKASASTVLTVEYIKPSGKTVNVPLYSYWEYGNGRVASFTSSLCGEWVSAWQEGRGERFFKNLLRTNTPEQRRDCPFTISIVPTGIDATFEMIPSTLNPSATASIRITAPDGAVTEERLTFDSRRYFYRFDTPCLGRYAIAVTYAYDGLQFGSELYFNLSYPNEYDHFAGFSIAELRDIIRNRGTVYNNTDFRLENNADEVATYEVSYTVPFLIAAVVLYVVDVVIRKLKWDDIRTLLRKKT